MQDQHQIKNTKSRNINTKTKSKPTGQINTKLCTKPKPKANANQHKHKSQSNAKVKVTATPKVNPIRPKNQIKINFKNKTTSETHERTHEQTCCKLHKQTHDITVALMRKEMQNWSTNRIENATKMHEESHGQHHTNNTDKTSYQPNVRSPDLRTHWTENWEFRKTVGQNIANWGALEGAPIRMCIRALAHEWDSIKNCGCDFYRKMTHIFLLCLKTQCDPR